MLVGTIGKSAAPGPTWKAAMVSRGNGPRDVSRGIQSICIKGPLALSSVKEIWIQPSCVHIHRQVRNETYGTHLQETTSRLPLARTHQIEKQRIKSLTDTKRCKGVVIDDMNRARGKGTSTP